MDNEIFCTTLSNRKFPSFHNIAVNKKSKWRILLISFVCHLMLPGMLLSYGVILAIQIQEDAIDMSWSILPPCLFCISWIITDPWARETADTWKKKITNRMMTCIGLLMTFTGFVLRSINAVSTIYAILFGILGGAGTSIVLTQIDYVLADTFETNLNKVRIICRCCQVIGQCLMPFVILSIFDFYGHHMSFLILSCFVLQILPFLFYLHIDSIPKLKTQHKFSNYNKSYSLFDDDDVVSLSSNNDIQLIEMSPKSWMSPSDEILSRLDNEPELVKYNEIDNYNMQNDNVDTRNVATTQIGVKRLTRIIEETEESEESDTESNSSNLSIKFDNPKNELHNSDEFIIKTQKYTKKPTRQKNKKITCYSTKKMPINKEVHGNIINSTHALSRNWTNDDSHVQINNSWISRMKCGCSAYSCYRMKRKTNNLLDYMNDVFMVPLLESIKMWKFYPAILINLSVHSVTFSIPFLFAILVKTLFSIEHSVKYTAFIISIHGFSSSLCILIFLPLLSTMAKSKYKYFSISGTLLLSTGLFVVMESTIYRWMLLGSVITGIGYGALISSYEETLRDLIGIRSWDNVRGSLDTLTGIFLILLGILIAFLLSMHDGIKLCFLSIISLHTLSATMWIFLKITFVFKNHRYTTNLWPQM